MQTVISFRSQGILILFCMLSILFSGCGAADSGDPKYEAQTIQIEEISTSAEEPISVAEFTVAQLRSLPQHELSASYQRTTGKTEAFDMKGPYISEVLGEAGISLDDYAGIGVMGSDGYYCLLSKEVIEATPDLMLAVVVDGNAKLDEGYAPAWLAVQGQLGPYWVKRVQKIILYEEIPEKKIQSVWVFASLTEGLTPYPYEYYGSKDASLELAQIFARFDHVDGKAFFTMKSADGFLKNEAMGVVKSRYYIKYEGVDAPTNISPYLKLGMNVQRISWFSTSEDAVIFPKEINSTLEEKDVRGVKGVPLSEILYEVGVTTIEQETFALLGTDGEKLEVPGNLLKSAILVSHEDGTAGILWEEGTGQTDLEGLLRIRLIEASSQDSSAKTSSVESKNTDTSADTTIGSAKKQEDTVLSVSGDGVKTPAYFSLSDLQGMSFGSAEAIYSTVNNWPVKKFAVAKGIDLRYLLKQMGLRSSAATIRVEAADGYYAVLTKEQLLGERYRYPKLLSASESGAVSVPPILAWEYENGTDDVAKAQACDLRLLVGQLGLSDVNTAPSVQNVVTIEVSTKSPGKWAKPTVTITDGYATITHEALDQVKLYYTLDGSNPTQSSPVYNPSTTYFQPNLIKPIAISSTKELRVKAIGFGKYDSEVLVYAIP